MKPYKAGDVIWVYDATTDSIYKQVVRKDEYHCEDTGERFVETNNWQIKDVQFVARSRKTLVRKLNKWFKNQIEEVEKTAEQKKAKIDAEVQWVKDKFTKFTQNTQKRETQ